MPLPIGSSIIMRSRRHHDAPDTDHLLLLLGIADHRERFLTDLILGCEVVRRVAVAVVDRCLGYELLDLDRVRAFDGDLDEFRILDLDVLVLPDLVAFDHVLATDGLPCHRVDVLHLDAVIGFCG